MMFRFPALTSSNQRLCRETQSEVNSLPLCCYAIFSHGKRNKARTIPQSQSPPSGLLLLSPSRPSQNLLSKPLTRTCLYFPSFWTQVTDPALLCRQPDSGCTFHLIFGRFSSCLREVRVCLPQRHINVSVTLLVLLLVEGNQPQGLKHVRERSVFYHRPTSSSYPPPNLF